MFSLLDYIMLAVTAAFGAIGLISIYKNAKHGINVAVLFLSFLFLYLGAGACFTLLSADSLDIRIIAQSYDIEKGDLARACLMVMVFGSTLWVLGYFFRRQIILSRAEITAFALRSNKHRHFEVLLGACVLLQAYVLMTGHLGFEGVLLNTNNSEFGMASPWALLANWMSVALPPACAIIMAARRKVCLPLLAGFLWNAGLVAIVSRRDILSIGVLSVLPLFIFPYSRCIRLWVIAGSMVFGGLMCVLFFSFRMSLRDKDLDRTDIRSIISGGIAMLTNPRAAGAAEEQIVHNVTTRTFNICYTSLIAKNARIASGANGLVLEYSILQVIPAFIYPQKLYFVQVGREEGLAMKALGIATNGDEYMAIVTTALTDFGYLGLPLYAMILYLVFAFAIFVIRCTNGSALGLVAFCFLLFTATDIQSAFTSMIIALRLIVTLCAIGGGWEYMLLAKRKLRPFK